MNTLIIRYDPDPQAMTCGWYRCLVCKAGFYGGGPALHEKGCAAASRGYEGLEFWVGDAAIRAILRKTGSLDPIDAEALRAALPDDVARIEADT